MNIEDILLQRTITQDRVEYLLILFNFSLLMNGINLFIISTYSCRYQIGSGGIYNNYFSKFQIFHIIHATIILKLTQTYVL